MYLELKRGVDSARIEVGHRGGGFSKHRGIGVVRVCPRLLTGMGRIPGAEPALNGATASRDQHDWRTIS